MKCIKKNDEILRVKEDVAETRVLNEGWSYCSKWEWKESNKPKVKEETKKKDKKKSKKKEL